MYIKSYSDKITTYSIHIAKTAKASDLAAQITERQNYINHL